MNFSLTVLKASTLALALLGGTAIIAVTAMPDVAWAGNGNGNGGGNGNGNGGGNGGGNNNGNGHGGTKSSDARDGGSRHGNDDHVSRPLRPNEKGRWNASNANQRALDAHIRNGNFNGTIGALSQYQLAGKAANGEHLSDDERRALETFVDTSTPEIPDSDVEDFLNQNSDETGLTFMSDDGVVSCVGDGCPTDPEELDVLNKRAQNAADGYVDDQQEEEIQARLDGFLDRSEQRIVDDSNKSLSPDRNEDLLDELADDLGIMRNELGEGMTEIGGNMRSAGREFKSDIQQAGREISSTFRGIFNNK
jgi:hypothetical protein